MCAPSVVNGVFSVNGNTYTYAMHYTATNNSVGLGSDNRIGAVFSNDGIIWSGQDASYNPIIGAVGDAGTYGAGQASTWNQDGVAKVTMFWTDTSTNSVYTATSIDSTGLHFGSHTKISTSGSNLCWNNDFAINSSDGYIYSAQPQYWRASGLGPTETYTMNLARIPCAALLSGGGTWQVLATIDTNLTGLPLNFAPGLAWNGFGDMAPLLASSGYEVYFGGGGQTVSAETWDLRWVSWTQADGFMKLRRYYTNAPHTSGGIGPRPASSRSTTAIRLREGN